MTQTILSILSHGGFKLVFIAIVVLYNFAQKSIKAAKKRDAEVRGNTQISDFSISDFSAPAPTATPSVPFPLARPAPSKSSPSPPTSSLGSPWSSNQNPFDDPKS